MTLNGLDKLQLTLLRDHCQYSSDWTDTWNLGRAFEVGLALAFEYYVVAIVVRSSKRKCVCVCMTAVFVEQEDIRYR